MSFQRMVYGTISLRITPSHMIPAQSPLHASNPRWFVCLPALMISLHCSLQFGLSWTLQNQSSSGPVHVPALQRSRLTCRSCQSVEQPSTVPTLCVILGSGLTADWPRSIVSKIASTCFNHLQRLRQLHDKVSRENMKQLVTSLVLSRLDYCNVVLTGLLMSAINPLQCVPNATTCLVLHLDCWLHVTSALHELH